MMKSKELKFSSLIFSIYDKDGSINSDAEIEMYDSLARNDIGITITGHMSVAPDLGLRADEVQMGIRRHTTTYISKTSGS